MLYLQLDLAEVTVVGASMGCAVIWSYIELFGEERLKQARLLFGSRRTAACCFCWPGGSA